MKREENPTYDLITQADAQAIAGHPFFSRFYKKIYDLAQAAHQDDEEEREARLAQLSPDEKILRDEIFDMIDSPDTPDDMRDSLQNDILGDYLQDRKDTPWAHITEEIADHAAMLMTSLYMISAHSQGLLEVRFTNGEKLPYSDEYARENFAALKGGFTELVFSEDENGDRDFGYIEQLTRAHILKTMTFLKDKLKDFEIESAFIRNVICKNPGQNNPGVKTPDGPEFSL